MVSRLHERNQNGHKRQEIIIDCLAFANDLALFSEAIKETKEQITSLQEQPAKFGLKTSFETTHFITNIEQPPKHLNLGENKIIRVNKSKYLGERIETNISEKEAFTSRLNKFQLSSTRIHNLQKNMDLDQPQIHAIQHNFAT